MSQLSFSELPSFSLLKISGTDAEKFLQGQFTCDLRTVPPQQSSFGAHCTYQGRVIANFVLFNDGSYYWLVLPKSNLAIAKAHLSKYAAFSKVTIEEMPADWKIYGAWQTEPSLSHNENLIIPLPHSDRCFICGPATQFSTTEKMNETAWQLADIRADIAYITPTTTEQFTPHMIGIVKLGGVSFKKGCYLGQEIVARTEHLGKAKRHLYHGTLETNQLPQAGDNIHDENHKSVGTIVSAAFASKNSVEFLAVLEDSTVATQNKLYWQNFILQLILP